MKIILVITCICCQSFKAQNNNPQEGNKLGNIHVNVEYYSTRQHLRYCHSQLLSNEKINQCRLPTSKFNTATQFSYQDDPSDRKSIIFTCYVRT